MTQTEDLHQDNGAAWDITAAIYERDEAADIAMLRAGGSSLLQPEKDVLGDLGPWCQRAIHLQCAGGVDTLSLLRQGAHEVVGVDISARMIRSAQRRAQALAANASWHVCDVLAVPQELSATADLVYTGRGALLWMMDLDAWAAVVYRLLKSGGRLFIFEGHPLDWVWDTKAETFRFLQPDANYFSQEIGAGEVWPRPFIQRQDGIDLANVKLHDFPWTLGQVLNSAIRAGLRIEAFNEYPLPFWNQFPEIPEHIFNRLPHTFSLLARKE